MGTFSSTDASAGTCGLCAAAQEIEDRENGENAVDITAACHPRGVGEPERNGRR